MLVHVLSSSGRKKSDDADISWRRLCPMREFLSWLRATCGHWVAVVTGAAFALAGYGWQVYEWTNPKTSALSIRPWMVIVVGGLILFWASFLAWRDEYRKRVAIEANARASTPRFTAHIDAVVTADVADKRVLCFLVNVGNIGGAPSILEWWRIHVLPVGRPEYEIKKAQPGENKDAIVLSSPNGKQITIRVSDFVTLKTFPVAVDPGTRRRGWLMATVPGELEPGTSFRVSFHDIRGQSYACDFNPGRGKGPAPISEIGHWPDVSIMHGVG
jgi:hypothetical protein